MPRSSRISGFYKKSISERADFVAEWAGLTREEAAALAEGLAVVEADKMVENVVGRYALPLGIGTNFMINGRDYLVPMVVEEPSVVAGVSYAALLARAGGGFRTGSTEPVMVGQVQLLDVPDAAAAEQAIRAAEAEVLALATTSPTIARLGGGPRGLEIKHLATEVGPMLIVEVLYDVRDAMGANAINTAAEAIAPALERLSGGRALLRILSNLSDRRRAWAEVRIPTAALATGEFEGMAVARGIEAANAFALADAHRAATHNKGILNGIDAVALATGNDWRAIEAGAHAYAAREGRYRALTEWTVTDGVGKRITDVDAPDAVLFGRLELPLAVGTVGGATRVMPAARVALKILGVESARELSEVMAAVGLAQNLAAIRALATEGIQRGHMSLHARQVAVAAGATGSEVDRIAAQLVAEGQVRLERARELLAERRE